MDLRESSRIDSNQTYENRNQNRIHDGNACLKLHSIILNIWRREKEREETGIIPVSPKCGMSLLNE